MDWALRLGVGHIIMLLFLSIGSWSCAPVNSELHSTLVIGVVDPQRILQETVKGQQLSDTLNAFMKDRQVLVELDQKELRNLEDALRAQMTVLSQSARQLKEEQFRQEMAAYQQKIADLNREVQEKQQELQAEFRREVGEVVAQIASDRNLGLVLEHGPNSGTLFYQESWDISTDVIQTLNQMSDES
jgi:outer membrane protein